RRCPQHPIPHWRRSRPNPAQNRRHRPRAHQPAFGDSCSHCPSSLLGVSDQCSTSSSLRCHPFHQPLVLRSDCATRHNAHHPRRRRGGCCHGAVLPPTHC